LSERRLFFTSNEMYFECVEKYGFCIQDYGYNNIPGSQATVVYHLDLRPRKLLRDSISSQGFVDQLESEDILRICLAPVNTRATMLICLLVEQRPERPLLRERRAIRLV